MGASDAGTSAAAADTVETLKAKLKAAQDKIAELEKAAAESAEESAPSDGSDTPSDGDGDTPSDGG